MSVFFKTEVMERLFSDDEGPQKPQQTTMTNPVTLVLQLLSSYGWLLVGGAAVVLYVWHAVRPRLDAWRQAREDAHYHKNPDVALARMEAIQRARERQQQKLLEASERALQLQREREARKRAEAAERLAECGAGAGRRLGARDDGEGGGPQPAHAPHDDEGYLPLSAGESTSSYRPPKRSKCSGGGCGK